MCSHLAFGEPGNGADLLPDQTPGQPYPVLRLGLLPAGQVITIFSSKTHVDRAAIFCVDLAYIFFLLLFSFVLFSICSFLGFLDKLSLILLGPRIMSLNV